MASLSARLLKGQRLLPMLILFALLLIALALVSDATENSARFGQLYSWLLLTSTAGLLLLAVLIGHRLYRLISRYRAGVAGARLTLRLATIFVVLSIAPVAVVYYFSLQFLQRGIDSWFDVRVEQALEDALQLGQASLDLRMREVRKQIVRMAEDLVGINQSLAALTLDEMLNANDASEVTLFGESGRIIATASSDSSVIVPDHPSEVVLLQVRQGLTYVGLEPLHENSFQIRSAVQVPTQDPQSDAVILQCLFPVSARIGSLADSVQSAFEDYKELVFLRTPLKASFILILSLVLLLAILAAFWTALYAARQLVEPIRELAVGTQSVAAGQFDRQLPLTSNDELGFLVHSFNEMTRRLAQARDSALSSQQLLERQRAYLEVVLARLSSGVLALKHDGRLRTCNTAAGQILGLNLSAFIERELQEIGSEHSHFRHFFEAIEPHLSSESDWRQEITLFSGSGRQVLMCRGSSLPDPLGAKGGHVIVFDDITTLMQVERDAAWGEVARRLAHEIKNPLTPIQLATERIRYKYLKTMDAETGKVLERSTHTIIQQVQAMKDMVDAFNEYARPSQLRLVTVSLNEFITEVLYLYRNYPANVEIQLHLDPQQPAIEADKGRFRQLLHNLVKNAIEAIGEGSGSTLQISTRCGRDDSTDYVELGFQDNGPGFPDDIGDIFEPYVTTKIKGTGLGLAVVKKIVDEHGGVLRLESPSEGGARIVIRFPASPISVAAAAGVITTVALPKTKEAG